MTEKKYTCRQGATIPTRWQVLPVIMTGESKLPTLKDITAEK